MTNPTTKTEKSRVAKDLLTYDDLLQIVELIKSAEAFSEFHLKVGDIELDLRKATAAGGQTASTPAPASGAVVPDASAAVVPDASAAPSSSPTHSQAAPSPHRAQPGARSARTPVDIPAGFVVIESPMVGTFYRRPEPGAQPFVEVGDFVERDTTVCIIEVMKLMNSISAGSNGRITHILVDDAEAVQAGQQLIVIDPRG